jgi:type IV fimbrial biogenesis protein FimT
MKKTLFNRAVLGFTLIELLITIALIAILLTIIAPSFTGLVNSNKLSTTRDLLISSLHTAQQQALSKSISTYICPTTNGSNCLANWVGSTGWIVYEDLDRSGTLDAGEMILIQIESDVNSIANTTNQIEFRSTGHVVGGTPFTLCSISTGVSSAQITITKMGRITFAAAGGCP